MVIPGGEWDYHDYHGGRTLAQVNKTENDSPSELEWGDLEHRLTDSEFGGGIYLSEMFTMATWILPDRKNATFIKLLQRRKSRGLFRKAKSTFLGFAPMVTELPIYSGDFAQNTKIQ